MKRMKYTSREHSEKMAKNAAKVNKSKKPDGYIYILKYGDNDIYKFGVSGNPDRRIKDIDSCSPVPIKELGRFFFKNVYEIEEMIHDNIRSYAIRREWFNLKESIVLEILEEIKQMSKQGIYLIRKNG